MIDLRSCPTYDIGVIYLSDEQLYALDQVLHAVVEERNLQQHKWGEQNHPDGTGGEHSRTTANMARSQCEEAFAAKRGTWKDILREEYAEAVAETEAAKLRVELIQIAAVCCAWIEAIDRREGELAKLPG